MKQIRIAALTLATIVLASCGIFGKPQAKPAAQPDAQKVVIFGDSYSTFKGYLPEGYATWYHKDINPKANDCNQVDSCWWSILCADMGYDMILNNSYSGSTICNRGYHGDDYTATSFTTRVQVDIVAEDGTIGRCGQKPDIIFIFGGTNDSWAGDEAGVVLPRDQWRNADLYQCLPATSWLLGYLTEKLPDTRIVMIINSQLRSEIMEGIAEASRVYGVDYVQLHDIDKQTGHPSKAGMRAIAKQIEEIL